MTKTAVLTKTDENYPFLTKMAFSNAQFTYKHLHTLFNWHHNRQFLLKEVKEHINRPLCRPFLLSDFRAHVHLTLFYQSLETSSYLLFNCELK